MTLAEVGELGRQCLTEYEERLNVRGTGPYDYRNSPKQVETCFECSLSGVSSDTIKPLVDAFLEKLLTETHGAFVMSEPLPEQSMAREFVNVAHNFLRLSFIEWPTPPHGNVLFLDRLLVLPRLGNLRHLALHDVPEIAKGK